MNEYHMRMANASILLSLWSAFSNGLAIFGAFLADSCLGRFPVIALGSIFSLLGMTMLWLTAMIPQMKPAPCDQSTFVQCNSPSLTQYTVLFASSGLISIGAGCIRPCSMAFGLDQLDNEENPNNQRVLEIYIHWYNASTAFSAVVAITAIVYIQRPFGLASWFCGPAFLMVFSALVFFTGSFLYIKVQAGKSLLVGFVQVLVVAFKHRNVSLPPSLCDDRYLCTVEQVESLKAFLRVKPVWSTGIMVQVSVTQNSFAMLQTMDRHIASDFQIPAGSISVFMVLILMMLYGIYECIMVPLTARYTEKQRDLSPKTRIGIGLLISCIGMATSATTARIRQANSIEFNPDNDPNAGLQMSAMWLVPQFALLGAAEAFSSSGQIEYYYTQFSKSMASIAVALYTLGMAVSSLVGSLLVDIVDRVTSRGGRISWLSSNLNEGHVDFYYWLITFLGVVNFVYFLICCSAYGPPSKLPRMREDPIATNA